MSVGYLKKCSTGVRPKESHPTQALAEAQRSRMIASGKWQPSASNTYFCNQCGGYHAGRIGNASRGRGRKVRARPVHHTQ